MTYSMTRYTQNLPDSKAVTYTFPIYLFFSLLTIKAFHCFYEVPSAFTVYRNIKSCCSVYHIRFWTDRSWFHNDMCFFLLTYAISNWQNGSILNFNTFSGRKVSIVGIFERSKLKIPSSFQKLQGKQKNN